MSEFITCEIIGEEEFHRILRDLAKCLPNEKVEPVMLEGAKTVADAAKFNAASVTKRKTGNLLKGIKAKLLKPISLQPRSAVAVSNAPHAYLIEYGHVNWRGGKRAKNQGHRIGGKKGSLEFTPAHPYFRPAVDTNKGRVQNQVIEDLWALIMGACK